MSDALLNAQQSVGRQPMVGRMMLAVTLAAIAGLMFGLDIGVISGALGFIQNEFHISPVQESMIVSSMTVGATLGALVSGAVSYALGRRRSLTYSAIMFVLGAVLCAVAQSVMMLVVARLILGLAIGVASFVAPLYISEIADESRRGGLISMYQLMITLGIMLAFVSNAVLSYSESWRWMLGILAIPGVLFLVGSFFLPDTPRWLMLRGRDEDALKTLTELRSTPEIARGEIEGIRAQLNGQQKQRGFALFLENRNFRRSVFLGVGLQAAQQFTAINVIMYYGPRIFSEVGFGQDGQMWGTATIGLVNCLATFIAIAFADKWGRRPLLVTGFAVMAVGLGVLAVLMGMGDHGSTLLHYLAVAVLLCFIVGFAFSAGPLIWVLCSEVQPLQGRDFGVTCSTVANWVTNTIAAFTFPVLLSNFGASPTFWLYAGLNALFIFMTLYFVPETKGVSLEAIEARLNAGYRLRNIGR